MWDDAKESDPGGRIIVRLKASHTLIMTDVYIFRYNSSGGDFDGDSSNVEHISSDAEVSKYRWTIPSDWDDVEQLEVLVVGGGGGGGRGSDGARGAAGGGGEGVIYSRSIFKEDVVDEDGKVESIDA